MGYFAYAEVDVSDSTVTIFCTDGMTLHRTQKRLTELTGWDSLMLPKDIDSVNGAFSVGTTDSMEAYGTYRWLVRVLCEDGWEPIGTRSYANTQIYTLCFKKWTDD